MATNKNARDTMVVVSVIVAICVTIFANLLADKKFGRIDLTKEGRYSLSQPFRNILNRLDDTCEITYYVSERAPAGFDRYRRDMLDKLHEIETASDKRIKINAVDPTDNKELRERLIKEGFQREIADFKKDQATQALIFSGLEITYKDKPKVKFQEAFYAEALEYMIGSTILELTSKQKPVIAVMAPAAPPQPGPMGRRPQGGPFDWIKEGAWDREKKFDVKSIDLTENSSIPADTSLFIMVEPKTLNERQKYEVTRFLAGGGKMLLLASEFKISYEFGWRTEKTPTGLEDYLKDLGVTMGQDIIEDTHCIKMDLPNNFGMPEEHKRSPIFIQILPENIDQESVLTQLMPQMMMIGPCEIALDAAKLAKNAIVPQVLAKTSKQTWTVPFAEGINFEESNYDEEKQVYTGQRNVFVMLDGQFPFPYADKPVPPWDAHAPAPPEKDKDKDKKVEPVLQKKAGSLAIFSGPEAFSLTHLSSPIVAQYVRGNFVVIPNMAENFSLGDDLIRLRTKSYETRTIKSLGGAENDWRRLLLKVGLIGGPAIVLFIFATLWFVFRRAKQVRYERKYAATIGPSSFTP